MIARDEWLHVDNLGRRLIGAESLPPAAWLYLKIACTGLSNPDARYVMIDEVQDYTIPQLAVLARFFPRAHFMLLGDENQAIREGGLTFAQVKSTFERLRGEVSECHLMTSYRSTPSITDLFARLLPESERMEVSSVQRESAAPPRRGFRGQGRVDGGRARGRARGGLERRGAHRRHRAVEARGNEAWSRLWETTPPSWLMRRERCLGRDACCSRCRSRRDLSSTTSSFRTQAQDSSPPMIASRKTASTRAFRAPRASSTCSHSAR